MALGRELDKTEGWYGYKILLIGEGHDRGWKERGFEDIRRCGYQARMMHFPYLHHELRFALSII